MVAERFVVSCFPTAGDTKSDSYVKETKLCCYLTFSMHDVVWLRRQVADARHVDSSRSDELHGSARKACPLGECDNTQAKIGRLWCVQESLPLNQGDTRASRTCAVNQQSVSTETENTNSEQSEVLPGGCVGSIDSTQSSHHTEHRNAYTNQAEHESMSRSSQLFLVTRKDALRVKHRVNSKPALSFFVSVQFLGEPRLANINNDSEASGDRFIIRHVVLDVHGGAVSLYPALHVGCLYRLVNMNATAAAASFPSSGRLKKALATTDTCQCVRVDDGLTILPACSLPTTSYGHQLEVWHTQWNLTITVTHWTGQK